MAIPPEHLLIGSTREPWTNDRHLLNVHAAIMNQIAQSTCGTLVLDEVLHSIAWQLHNALHLSGCLIFRSNASQQLADSDTHLLSISRSGLPPTSLTSIRGANATRCTEVQSTLTLRVNVATPQQQRLNSVCRDVCQYYHGWLTQGKPVIVPEIEQQLPLALQDAARECGLSALSIVPMLHQQSYIGGIALYQCEQEREWTSQEIAFVQAIAAHCAIALTLAELEQRSQIELKKRQESESALQESQRRLRAIYNQTNQFIALLTPDGIVLEANQAILDFAGLQEQDIVGRPFWEAKWWLPSLETSGPLQQAIAASAAGTFIRYEVNVVGKSNRVATLDFSLKAHRDETEQVVLLIFEGRDITDYKQTQTALQASVVRNRALLEAIPDEIFRVTRDGIYLDWKPAKQDVLAVGASEIIGQHLHQVLPTKVAGLIWHHVELALETNEMQIVEYQQWLNKKSHNFEVRLVKSGSDEVAAIVQDVTDRVEVRVALAQLNDALEIRVAERTAALREANSVLRAEIIERNRAQEKLKESEERFRNLVETSSDWVWEVDENAVYTYASPKVKSLLGYEPSEVLGKTPFDLMPPEERQHAADLFAPLAASRQPFTCFESTNIHKDGHLVILERSGVPIFDAKGKFRGYRGIDRDITERKQAEKELHFLHSIRKAIFESQDFHAALGVALNKVCEATGWDFGEAWVPKADGSVLECSPAWCSKTKSIEPFRSASEKLTFAPGIGLPGRVWVSQQPEWRRDISAESNQIYLRAEIAKEVGLKAGLGIPLLTPNGVLAVLVFYMFESREEDQGLIELISASTELGLMIQRKQAEGEIRKALEKEKELTELKSRFISMTSHEFRTPLTTIQSSAELLEHYSHKWTEEKKLTHLRRIQTSVKHMTSLLNDILIIGKAEAGKLKLNPAPLDLEDFCRNLVEELRLNDTKQHAISFTCDWGLGNSVPLEAIRGTGALVRRDWELGDSVPLEGIRGNGEELTQFPITFGCASCGRGDCRRQPASSNAQCPIPCMDEKLLRQILENLLSNAIKYSPAGSSIEFTLRYANNWAVFQIRDRGIGIPAEDQQQLFETFHRARNVGTIAGTGLGLAIVKKCVDIHQGQIAVESQIGVGTTFTVTLPIYNSLIP